MAYAQLEEMEDSWLDTESSKVELVKSMVPKRAALSDKELAVDW